MVERYPAQRESDFFKSLDQATTEIEKFQNKICQSTNNISKEDIVELLKNLEQYNEAIESDNLEDKKLTQLQDSEINERIEEALKVVLSFHKTNPTPATKKNVDEMIVSLFSALTYEVDKFKRNVENLKDKWKIVTSKIQSSQKSKGF